MSNSDQMQESLVIFIQFIQQELQTADDFNYYFIKTPASQAH